MKVIMNKKFIIENPDHSLPYISHGKGIYLYDTEGKEYIDGSSGAVTANIGHGVEEIIEAVNEQARKVSFVHRGHFMNEHADKLSGKLASWAPGDLNNVLFVNSGSEATEMAQKLAIHYWQEKGFGQKNRILSRWTSYHGNTLGALSMSGHPLRRQRFSNILEDYPCVSVPHYYRCADEDTQEEFALRSANELETAIFRIGSDNIAAFIAEPIIGASGGAITPPQGYYQRIREICDENNILFIVDEVMTGMGRTGRNFGIDHWEVVPDLMALGKGMGAGYTPIAATLFSDRIIDVINKGSGSISYGHTYGGNPQSSAIALAVMEYLEKHEIVKNSAKQGSYLMSQLESAISKFPIVGEVRGKGLLCGMEFVENQETKESFPASTNLMQRIIGRAFEKGLIVYAGSSGTGDAIIIAPPLVVTDKEIDKIISILFETIEEIQNELTTEGVLVNSF